MSKQGQFVAAFFCRECNRRLTNHQVMCSHGVCPLCGHSSNSTIVDHEKRPVWVERRRPWWQRLFA